MKTQYSNAVRWGVVVLPIAAILALGGTLLHGAVIDATRDAEGFVQAATAPTFGAGWVLVILSQVAAILGFVALYGALSQPRGLSGSGGLGVEHPRHCAFSVACRFFGVRRTSCCQVVPARE